MVCPSLGVYLLQHLTELGFSTHGLGINVDLDFI